MHNDISTPVNGSLIRGRINGRPLSLAAALGVLGVSLYVSHEGLQRLLPGAPDLVGVLTVLLACLAILQWTALGRAAQCREGSHRRNLVFAQALLLGAVEATLNWNGVVQLAALGGADWSGLFPSLLVGVFAIGGAWLNVTVKYTSCEPVDARPGAATIAGDTPPGSSRPVHDGLFGANVHNFRNYTREDLAAARRESSALQEFHRETLAAHPSSTQPREPGTGRFARKSARKRQAA